MAEDSTKKLPDGDRLDRLIQLVGGIDKRLTALEQKVDERLHDTRPIWEAIQTQLNEFRGETEKRLERMESRLMKIERSMGQLVQETFQMRTDQPDLRDRVDGLEKKVS